MKAFVALLAVFVVCACTLAAPVENAREKRGFSYTTIETLQPVYQWHLPYSAPLVQPLLPSIWPQTLLDSGSVLSVISPISLLPAPAEISTPAPSSETTTPSSTEETTPSPSEAPKAEEAAPPAAASADDDSVTVDAV